jgi:hypothetical protein
MAEHQWSSKDHAEDAIHRKREKAAAESLAMEPGGSVHAAGFEGRLSRDPLSHPGNPRRQAEILLSFQRSHGNAYVQRLLRSRGIQAKLTVNSPDDEFEKEADAMGEEVARLPFAQVQRQAGPEEEEEIQAKRLQRQGEEEEELLQAKRLDRQSLPEEEEEPVQAESTAKDVPEVTEAIERRID